MMFWRESGEKKKKIHYRLQLEFLYKTRITTFIKTYGCHGIDYRVAWLFIRYLTAIGIIPESLNSIGQF